MHGAASVARSPLPWARAGWWSVTVAVNAVVIGSACGAAEASLINLLIAIAARHDLIVRAAFRLARSYPLHQLTYHLGQLHRAAAMAATVWFAVALSSAVGLVVLAILLTMIWTARDRLRHVRHDRFERIHRYGGWTALAILTGLVAAQPAPPAVALLAAVVGLVVQPLLRL
jgi:hypothetical protein